MWMAKIHKKGSALQNLPVSGTPFTQLSFHRVHLRGLFWGGPFQACHLGGRLAPVARTAFLGHSHPCSFPPSSEPERPPPAQSPEAPTGRPLPSCLVPPSRVPCRVTGNSHGPGAGCPRWPGAGVGWSSEASGRRNKRYPRGLPHSPAAGTHLLTSSLQGVPKHLLVLISAQRCPQGSR